VFHRADRNEARKALGIPGRMKILLSTAKSKRRDVWQDHQMMRDAICHVSRRIGDIRLRVILLGRKYAKERVGAAEYVSVPYQESKTLALYYQSADAYVQPSRADTFPNAVLEALACGIPVLATAVGGIPEQVKGLRVPFCKGDNGHMGRFGMDEATGVLVAPCDVKGMAEGIKLLLKDEGLCRRLGYNGAGDTTKRFDLDLQAETYLNWYEGMIEERAQDRRIPSSIKRDTSMKARESLDHESGA
jgi:glycosyltransferase involved in cell wall biosynthesis